VNDAFRVLRKRVRVFARRHVANPSDIDDMTSDACEKAFRHFRALTAKVELDPDNLGTYVVAAYKRAGVALQGARIDQYRKREIERRFFERASPELIAASWLSGANHVPAPDQRLIVAETMAAVLRHSTTPGQRQLGEVLQRHVESGDLDLSPAELAREARETANCRHAWARKLRTKQLG
jgi:DNA-directed RNA polymerase specialized sigma24 family protein